MLEAALGSLAAKVHRCHQQLHLDELHPSRDEQKEIEAEQRAGVGEKSMDVKDDDDQLGGERDDDLGESLHDEGGQKKSHAIQSSAKREEHASSSMYLFARRKSGLTASEPKSPAHRYTFPPQSLNGGAVTFLMFRY